MPLRTSSLEFISLTIVRRGVSTRMQPGPAIALSERGRPDSRLISPKNAAAEARADVRRRGAFERHFAVDDREERSAELARRVDRLALAHDAGRARLRLLRRELLAEHVHLALRIFVLGAFRVRDDHVALDDQLAELQAVHLPEHRDQRLEALDHLVDRPLERQAVELVFEQRVIGGLQVVAVDELDDVVALVHRLLDQRVAGERADHVHAGHVALVVARQLGNRVVALVRKLDADRLDELARRNRAEPRDDAMALDGLFAGRGLHTTVSGGAPGAPAVTLLMLAS